MSRSIVCMFVASMALVVAPVLAQTAAGQPSQHSGASAAAPLSEGQVRKVDKSAGKLTIRHGELRNLDMPPMTMVFRAKDPTVLDKLKEGDKIKFVAEKVDGVYTVTVVEVVK